MPRLLLFALLAGCSRPPPETSPFLVRIAATGDLAPFGPFAVSSETIFALDWVYEPLVRVAADGSTTLALASRVDRLDNKSIRAWIRPDARFSDGTPVAARDVVQAVRSFKLNAYENDGAVVIESDAVLPDAVLAPVFIYKRAGGAILGTGPFSVVEHDSSHILLRRNLRLPNHIDEVVIRSFATPREAFSRTLARDVEIYPLIDSRQVEFFEGVPRFHIIRAPSTNTIAVAFSTTRLDRDTRLALLATLRSAALTRWGSPEVCTPMGGETVPSRSLPPGRPLQITVPLQIAPHLRPMALAVQRVLGARGGDIEDISYREWERRLATGDFDLLMAQPIAWPQSEMARMWHSNSLLTGRWFSNPKVDAALDSGDWARAMQELRDDPPVIYICLLERLAIVDARIKDARIGPYGFFETLPDWEIDR